MEADPGPKRRAPRPSLRSATADVRDVSFPIVFRGYERETVDAYVMHVNQLIAELEATSSPEAAIKRALDSVGEETSGILQHARETADQITSRSRAQADDRVQAAEREAQAIRADAEARLREIDADTDAVWQERARLIEEVRRLAAELSGLADIAAERMPVEEEPAAPEGAGPEDEEPEPTAELVPEDLESEDEDMESPPEPALPPERAEPGNGSPAPPPDPGAAQTPQQRSG